MYNFYICTCMHTDTLVLEQAHTHVVCLLLYIRGNEKNIARCCDMVTHTKTMKVAVLNFRQHPG
jgi:hypothetical protein